MPHPSYIGTGKALWAGSMQCPQTVNSYCPVLYYLGPACNEPTRTTQVVTQDKGRREEVEVLFNNLYGKYVPPASL